MINKVTSVLIDMVKRELFFWFTDDWSGCLILKHNMKVITSESQR